MAPYADISMRFKNGKLTKTAAPAWFKKSIKDDGDWLQMLRQAGASEVADFDDGADSIHVLRREGGYIVVFWDTHEAIGIVFIDSPADYLMFRAQYIAPLAQLIMSTDRYEAWKDSRKNQSLTSH